MDERMQDPGPSVNGAALKASVSDLAGEVATLMRQEAEVARCEIAAAAKDAKAGATKFGLGAAFAHVGVLALTAAVTMGLTLLLDRWLETPLAALVSTVVVGAALAAAGYFLIRRGSEDIRPSEFVPRRAIESLKENLRWAREKM